MVEVKVRRLEAVETASWPDSLRTAATFTALDSWSRLVEQTYGYRIHRLEAAEGERMAGILLLTEVRHPIFGKYLATSPFGSYGGFAFSSTEARDALLKEAQLLASELAVEYAVVRFVEEANTPPVPWLQNPLYSTYLVDLPADPEELMINFGSQHRKHTRQSLRKGFKVRFGQRELLDETYNALALSMHELGSPYHSKRYLQRMADLLGDNLEFVVIKDAKDALVGSAVLAYHDGAATNLHANILHEYRSDYAGECLYWNLLEHYCGKGLKICDMGRSLNGSGNETFKLKWKPRRIPLAYWYCMPKGGHIPELNQKSSKFQFAIWMWKRLPGFAVRVLGPHLINGLV